MAKNIYGGAQDAMVISDISTFLDWKPFSDTNL